MINGQVNEWIGLNFVEVNQSVLRPLVPRLNFILQKCYVSDINIVIDKDKIMITDK